MRLNQQEIFDAEGNLTVDPNQLVEDRELLLVRLDQLTQRYESLLSPEAEMESMRLMLERLIGRDAQQEMLAKLDPAKLDDPVIHKFI